MLAAQSIYGAAASRSWDDAQLSLGCNLSLSLPEDKSDTQPLWTPDHSSCLVADLRLDNREELARQLDLAHPAELADSAILLAAWQRWGPTCLDHIVGGFAFAVWTPSRQELFAARDHAGERPLFYHRSPDLFALASMPKGLLALPGAARGFDEARIVEWLATIDSDRTRSFFEGIERVPPGHLLRVTPDAFECREYWRPGNAAPVRYRRDQDYADALLEIFDRATQARLRSSTPIGSHLSAGLDSSSVTASAARLLAAQGERLTAFTAVPRQDFNGISQPWQVACEAPYAAETAGLYPNIDHVLVDSSGYELLPTMRRWIDAMDEPAVNVVNSLWLSAIYDRARQRGIGVMLEGATGNHSISWETWSILTQFFRRGRWIKLLRTAASLRRHGDISIRAAARRATEGLLPDWLDRRLIPRGDLQNQYASLASPDWNRRNNLDARIYEYSFHRSPDPRAERSRFYEQMDFGPIHAAVQAVAGVEVRDPTADKRVLDFCWSIPVEQYVAGGHSRSLIRRAMRGRLPESTRLRYSRGHQGADWYLPMGEALPGLRSELALLRKSPAAGQALDLPVMAGLIDDWPTSGYHTREVSFPWHLSLSRAFSMGYFLRSHESALASAPAVVPPSVPASPAAAPVN
jgi:asparagine synthase (glutamine-hydrolysing)